MFIGARVIILITAIYYTISTCTTIWACSPREKMWNPLITKGHCLDNNILVLFTCLFNIVSDIAILVLPARSVWRLQIPLRKKIAIVSLFAIGLFACIANAFIILYTLRMGGPTADLTYNAAWQGYWAYAKIASGLVVTCTLTLPKFIEARGKRLRAVISTLGRPVGSLAQSTKSLLSSSGKTRTDATTIGVGSHGTDSGNGENWRRLEDQSITVEREWCVETARPKEEEEERWKEEVPIYNQFSDRIEF
ncbi:MAG: hypothetical protein Q9183_002727, partial [Haloplaca sp. 2 TL-2023]